LAISFIFRKSFGRSIVGLLGKYAIHIGFLITLASLVGSLLYSNVLGFDPCALCWWQRIFIYPQVVIFFVAMIKKDKRVFDYIIPLSILVFIVALYNSYLQMDGVSLLPCDASGPSCSKVLVKEFGYITIPIMSLTVALYTLALAWAHRIYDKENSYT